MATADILAGFSPFDRLDDAQRSRVAETAREQTFVAGTQLFHDGEPALGCWLVRSGQIALQTSVPARGQVVIQTLGPGNVLGWSWLVPPHHWHFTATASTDVTTLALDTDRLQALADQDPALGYPLALGFFELLLARLQSTRARLLDVYGSPGDR